MMIKKISYYAIHVVMETRINGGEKNVVSGDERINEEIKIT